MLNLFTIALEGSRQVVVEGSRPGKALFPWLFPADQKAKSISVGVLDIRCPKLTQAQKSKTPLHLHFLDSADSPQA